MNNSFHHHTTNSKEENLMKNDITDTEIYTDDEKRIHGSDHTISAIARILDKDRSTIRKAIRNGGVEPAGKDVGGHSTYNLSAVCVVLHGPKTERESPYTRKQRAEAILNEMKLEEVSSNLCYTAEASEILQLILETMSRTIEKHPEIAKAKYVAKGEELSERAIELITMLCVELKKYVDTPGLCVIGGNSND